MKKAIIVALATLLLSGCSREMLDNIAALGGYPPTRYGGITENAFAPGVHRDQYGSPVTYQPAFGGVPGEMLTVQPDAYGLGVGQDQYGRPVYAVPAR